MNVSRTTLSDLQRRTTNWGNVCFGDNINRDKQERAFRFGEESLETLQACGVSEADAHALVKYTYGRPIDSPEKELGQALITLMLLASAYDLELQELTEKQLERCWTDIKRIRAKQQTKPMRSPLPGI